MPLTFNAIPVAQTSHQKHLGLYLDEKLNFNHHIKEMISKVNTRELKFTRRMNILKKDKKDEESGSPFGMHDPSLSA